MLVIGPPVNPVPTATLVTLPEEPLIGSQRELKLFHPEELTRTRSRSRDITRLQFYGVDVGHKISVDCGNLRGRSQLHDLIRMRFPHRLIKFRYSKSDHRPSQCPSRRLLRFRCGCHRLPLGIQIVPTDVLTCARSRSLRSCECRCEWHSSWSIDNHQPRGV